MTQKQCLLHLESIIHDQSIDVKPGNSYMWSPSSRTVFYKIDDSSQEGIWSLLHEVGHGISDHNTYTSDFELIQLEREAWDAACTLAKKMQHRIDDDHIEDCLDTYREWQHSRSICPQCGLGGVQTARQEYCCVLCERSIWSVTESRFCRTYRKKKTQP